VLPDSSKKSDDWHRSATPTNSDSRFVDEKDHVISGFDEMESRSTC
jgi:hypothetical protein